MDIRTSPNMFHGMQVFIIEPFPNMQLSQKVTVTDEFRSNFNAWLLDFFGTTKDEILMMPDQNCVFLSSKNDAKLKQAAPKGEE